jgi:hypothetical protein
MSVGDAMGTLRDILVLAAPTVDGECRCRHAALDRAAALPPSGRPTTVTRREIGGQSDGELSRHC